MASLFSFLGHVRERIEHQMTLNTQTANQVFAGPATAPAALPTFRALVTADMPAGTGTVTSVALTMPAEFSVAGSPVTTTGTLAVTKATQAANLIYAGPTSGAAAAPTFRAQTNADLPSGSWILIQTQVGNGTSTATLTFPSIPATYRTLFVVFDTLTTSGANPPTITMRMNADTGGNYDDIERYSQGGSNAISTSAPTVQGGSAVVSAANVAQTSARVAYAGGTTLNTGLHYTAWIPAYRDTGLHKSYHCTGAYKNGSAAANMFFEEFQGFWRSTVAINELSFTVGSGFFTSSSTISLYGITG